MKRISILMTFFGVLMATAAQAESHLITYTCSLEISELGPNPKTASIPMAPADDITVSPFSFGFAVGDAEALGYLWSAAARADKYTGLVTNGKNASDPVEAVMTDGNISVNVRGNKKFEIFASTPPSFSLLGLSAIDLTALSVPKGDQTLGAYIHSLIR